jgi:hypothetical protein
MLAMLAQAPGGEVSFFPAECRNGESNRDAGAADSAIGEAVARYVSARRNLADAT